MASAETPKPARKPATPVSLKPADQSKTPLKGNRRGNHYYQPITVEDIELDFLSVLPELTLSKKARRHLFLNTPFVLLVPLLYLLLIFGTVALIIAPVATNFAGLQQYPLLGFSYLYSTVFLAITFLYFFFVKPVFAKSVADKSQVQLDPTNERLLHTYINKIAEKVGGPKASVILLTMEPTIKLTLRNGIRGLLNQKYQLSIGAPLLDQLNSQQLTCLIAREFAFYNQAIERPCVWIIRELHHWFHAAWLQVDNWDAFSSRIAQTRKNRISRYFITELMLATKITRQLFRIFFYITDSIVRHPIHQLYFRADEINSHLCGRDALRSADIRLDFIRRGFTNWQEALLNDIRTLDNDPFKQIAQSTLIIVDAQKQAAKVLSLAFDAPSWNKRDTNLKKVAATQDHFLQQVLFLQQYPVKIILNQFEKVSLDSCHLYSQYFLGFNTELPFDQSTPKNLTPQTDLIDRYFNDLFRNDHIFCPRLLGHQYGSSLSLKRDLQSCIQQLRHLVPDWKKTIESLEQNNRALYQAKIDEIFFSLYANSDKPNTSIPPTQGKRDLQFTIEHCLQTNNLLAVDFSTVEDLINQRLSLGVSYYCSIATAETSQYVKDAIVCLTVVKKLRPAITSLSFQARLLMHLIKTPHGDNDLHWDSLSKQCTTNCGRSIAEIRTALWQHTETTEARPHYLSNAMTLLKQAVNLNQNANRKCPVNYLNAARVTLYVYRELYANIMTLLVNACSETEQILSVTPLKLKR